MKGSVKMERVGVLDDDRDWQTPRRRAARQAQRERREVLQGLERLREMERRHAAEREAERQERERQEAALRQEMERHEMAVRRAREQLDRWEREAQERARQREREEAQAAAASARAPSPAPDEYAWAREWLDQEEAEQRRRGIPPEGVQLPLPICAYCGIHPPQPSTCRRCKSILYCGQQCANAHWKHHEKTCEPL